MNDIDMSRPGSELFSESQAPQVAQPYNSYLDVPSDHIVDDPLNTGVKSTFHDADGEGQLSDKELNFRALREETAKLKEQSEYWRGQAEALSKSSRSPEPEVRKDPYESLDFENTSDVKRAFDSMREQNEALRNEFRDTLASVQTKTQHTDWNNMVTQHVPQLTSKNPIFAEMIQKASNPYEAAYLLAELNAKANAQPTPPPQMNGNAMRAIANSQKPQTLASVGGNGTLSQADYYASMSDQDFYKIAARNLENI